MKLPKAIEILTIARTSSTPHLYPDYLDATQLGIEALKRVNWLRDTHSQIGASKLAGETKD